MTAKDTLLIVNDFHTPTIARLDQIYHSHKLWEIPEAQQRHWLDGISADCRAVATGSWSCDPRVYRLPQLQVIACFGVGVDGIDFDQTSRLGIKVTNTPDVLNDAVADLAMGLVIATSRNLLMADRFLRSGNWLNGPLPMGRSLTNKTLGIIGMGRIGEAIAQRAVPFQMNVAYHNRSRKQSPYQYYGSLKQLAEASDILLCVLPGGHATEKIVNAEVFQALGADGIFINVGRGSGVDEAALVDALSRKTIAAAGLDVYANEPQVPEALLGLDNVVLLPHIGSATNEARQAMSQLLLDNLAAYFSGSPLITPVEV